MFVKTCPDAIAFEKTVVKRISSILHLRLLAGIKNEESSKKVNDHSKILIYKTSKLLTSCISGLLWNVWYF